MRGKEHHLRVLHGAQHAAPLLQCPGRCAVVLQVSVREVLVLKFYDSDKFTGDDYLGMVEVQVDEMAKAQQASPPAHMYARRIVRFTPYHAAWPPPPAASFITCSRPRAPSLAHLHCHQPPTDSCMARSCGLAGRCTACKLQQRPGTACATRQEIDSALRCRG